MVVKCLDSGTSLPRLKDQHYNLTGCQPSSPISKLRIQVVSISKKIAEWWQWANMHKILRTSLMCSKCSVYLIFSSYYLWLVGWIWKLCLQFSIFALNQSNWDSNQKALNSLWNESLANSLASWEMLGTSCFARPHLLLPSVSAPCSSTASTWLFSVVIAHIFNFILTFCIDNLFFCFELNLP